MGCEVWVPAYSLSPAHSFPTQVDEAWACYQALIEQGKRVVLAGDSAGGNLAVGVAQRALSTGERLPEALLLFSPWLDLRPNSEASRMNQQEDSLFDAADMLKYASLYCANASSNNSLISPALGLVEGLPPVFLQGAKNEFLWPDLVAWHAALLEAGVNVVLDAEEQAFHSWQLFPTHSKTARISLGRAADFVQPFLSSAAALTP